VPDAPPQTPEDLVITKDVGTIELGIPKDIGIEGNKVKGLRIETKFTAMDVLLTVREFVEKPAAILAPAGSKVYAYLDIAAENLANADITKADIAFTVPFSWLEDQNVEVNDIVLFHLVNGEWEELPTHYVSEGGGEVTYTAVTASFSIFAIGSKSPEVMPAPEIPSSDRGIIPEPKTSMNPVFKVLFPIILLIVIVFFVFSLYHRHKEHGSATEGREEKKSEEPRASHEKHHHEPSHTEKHHEAHHHEKKE
jgi:PGF-pre-PGF domain-containing protein